MSNCTIILEATEACNPERRGIGVQMRAWLEAAPYADFPNVQFIIARQDTGRGAEPLALHAPNVRHLAHKAASGQAYVDYLYELEAELIFFPLAAPAYARKSSTKCVAVDYGMEDFYCRNYIAPRPPAEHIDVHQQAMQSFTGLITVSETSKRDLSWFFPEYKSKVKVVYPGVINQHVDTAAVTLPTQLRGTRYFLVMGYEHKKNIKRIANAFNTFKQRTDSPAKLVFVGKPGYGSAEIDKHIDALPSAPDIIRLGYISGAQKQLLLQNCHALIALAIYEGFGLSALEALHAGKIALVSDNGSLKEVVGQAGYTADPFSVASIEQQLTYIDTLTSNPNKKHIPEQLAIFDQAIQAKELLHHLADLAAEKTDNNE